MQQEDFITIEKKDGVATIWLDLKGEKMNVVSPDLIGLFDGMMDALESDPEVLAAVIISRKKDFIAGADIKSFKIEKVGDFQPITKKGHDILDRLENSKKPVVAAIHGTCYGLGTELSLACAARIASNDRSTKLALPEVKLGLLPGGGGTQRLPRLVGIQKALDMMLTGKNIFARKALKMGLVDELVHKSALHRSACELALSLVKKPLKRKDKRNFQEKVLESNPFTRKIIFDQARKMVQGMTKGNYPAPFEIINCVQIGYEKGRNVGFAEEIVRFEKLMLSPESEQLRNIFFAMTAKKKNPLQDKVREVDTLAMLGAGFMGAGIAEVSVTKGIDILLKDIKNETLASAKQTIWKNFKRKIKRKALTKVEAESYINSITGQLDYDNFDKADIVVEAVFEDLGLKQRILAETEAVTRPDCIFASNTSALPISAIAEKAERPELVIGMHYFSPVPKMPLLEIVKTEQTADWVIATCLDIGIKQGKTCIVVKDGPGFYTTRILAPMMNEALLMLEEGGDMLQIDKEMKIFGFPVGPVTLMDEVGIDVGAHIMSGDLMKHYVSQRAGAKVSTTLIELFKAGYSGRKNKKGFYLYDEKTGKKVKGKVNEKIYDFFGGKERLQLPSEEVQHRAGFAMVNEAALCLQEGIIDNPLDGDVGAIFGLGFPPFKGGPFRYMDSIGADKAVEILEKLAAKHGIRFKPADIIVEYAKEGKKFYD